MRTRRISGAHRPAAAVQGRRDGRFVRCDDGGRRCCSRCSWWRGPRWRRAPPPRSARSTPVASTASTNASRGPPWPVPVTAGSEPDCFEPRIHRLPRGTRPRVRGRRRARQRRVVRPGRALRQRRLPRGRVSAYPRRGHRLARGLRQPHACAVRRGRGQRPGPPRRPGPGDRGRGEPRPGVQPATKTRRTAPSARPSKDSGGSCTERRTSTRTATGPTRRTRPVPIGDDEPAGSEPARARARCSTCAARRRRPCPPDLTTGCFVVKDEVPGVGCLCARGSPMRRSTRTGV